MATVLIVAPVFALIALGYIAVRAGFVSEGANKVTSGSPFDCDSRAAVSHCRDLGIP